MGIRNRDDLLKASMRAKLNQRLTLRLDERPAPLFPSGLSEWMSEAQTRAQRWTTAGGSASPPPKTIKGRARGIGTPWSQRSPATPAVTEQVLGERSPQNGDPLYLPGALCLQLWQVRQPVSPVSAARARPRRGREPAHRGTGTT